MSPILGIIASAQQPALNATSFDSIATVTVGAGGSANVEFTSIPNTYKHLQIRLIGRDNRSAAGNSSLIQFNSDTGSNYFPYHEIYADGATATAYAAASAGSSIIIDRMVSNTSTASVFATMVIDILDYQNTNKNKTVRALGGYDANGSGVISYGSGLWMNTNAISTIKIYPSASASWLQYSSFALYGVK